jgi:hypothetical protein
MRCRLAVALLVCLAASPASAERRVLDRVPVHVDPSTIGAVVNSKTIFLNRCTGGCMISNGFTDSRTNKSSIGAGRLSAFEHGATSWTSVVNCMKSTFSRFNVNITDVDPGPNVDHFEVMVAGLPGEIGLSSNIGGIAEYSCQGPGTCSKYIPNAIVFAFANSYPNNPTEICATAAQEIAHTWTLDHVTDASDPMTYFSYSGMRQFKDNVRCGSDCVNGQSPFGLTCTGNEHTCMSTGQATQNDVQILLALFGPAGAVAPSLTVNYPTNFSAQQNGFTVDADCTSTVGIQEVQFSIDGMLKGTLTTPTGPYRYMTPSNLTEGPHKLTVLCATTQQAITIKTVDFIIGAPCPCAQAGYICFNNACIAGPDAPGGLGATCTGNADCVAQACASDGETMACTIPCDLEANNCPEGFGCLDAGGGNGVCWAGIDGGGCCDTGGGDAGSILFGLGVAAALVTRRARPRSRRASRA